MSSDFGYSSSSNSEYLPSPRGNDTDECSLGSLVPETVEGLEERNIEGVKERNIEGVKERNIEGLEERNIEGRPLEYGETSAETGSEATDSTQ
ncbi:hypothetical protein AMTRI_Chr03g141790 [Amborella trichopoda]